VRTLRVKLPPSARGAISGDEAVAAELTSAILDELNAKSLELIPDESDLVERSLYPLLPVIGPRHGAAVGAVMAAVRAGAWSLNADGTASVGGVTLQPDEFELTARGRAGQEVSEDGDLLVALDTNLDAELVAEGLAREVAHRLQALRRTAGYEISDRVRVAIGADAAASERLGPHRDWLAEELLATELVVAPGATLPAADAAEDVDLDGVALRLEVARS
jgi:isoleucyl-tRNA synthetase